MEEVEKKLIELENRVSNLEKEQADIFAEIKSLKDTDIKEIIEKLNNRLPLWATTIISLLTAIVGFLIALIVN